MIVQREDGQFMKKCIRTQRFIAVDKENVAPGSMQTFAGGQKRERQSVKVSSNSTMKQSNPILGEAKSFDSHGFNNGGRAKPTNMKAHPVNNASQMK